VGYRRIILQHYYGILAISFLLAWGPLTLDYAILKCIDCAQ